MPVPVLSPSSWIYLLHHPPRQFGIVLRQYQFHALVLADTDARARRVHLAATDATPAFDGLGHTGSLVARVVARIDLDQTVLSQGLRLARAWARG